jgi:hypothetical protein
LFRAEDQVLADDRLYKPVRAVSRPEFTAAVKAS